MPFTASSNSSSASELDCGELGTYGDQKKRSGNGEYDRDHIPSKAALKERARKLNFGRKLSTNQAAAIENGALSIVTPKSAHQQVSETYGGRNTVETIETDSNDLGAAAKKDTKAMLKEIDKHADEDCVEEYKAAAKTINKKTDADYVAFLKNILKTVK